MFSITNSLPCIFSTQPHELPLKITKDLTIAKPKDTTESVNSYIIFSFSLGLFPSLKQSLLPSQNQFQSSQSSILPSLCLPCRHYHLTGYLHVHTISDLNLICKPNCLAVKPTSISISPSAAQRATSQKLALVLSTNQSELTEKQSLAILVR